MNDAILIIMFAVALLIGISHKNGDVAFSLDDSNSYKGICALLIFFHHLTQRVEGAVFLHFGYLAVSGFMFISGYGMFKSYTYNGGGGYKYYRKIFFKKIPFILGLSFFSILFSAAYYALLGNLDIATDFRTLVIGNKLLNWYFPAALIMYAGMGLCVLIAKDNHKKALFYLLIAATVITGIISLAFYKKIVGIHWILSFFSFFAGAIVGYRELKNIKSSNLLCGVLFLLAIVFFIVGNYVDVFNFDSQTKTIKFMLHLVRLFVLICSGMLFSVAINHLCKRFSFGNQIKCLGTNSAFAIIVQGVALDMGKTVFAVQNDSIYIIVSSVLEFLLLFAVSFLYRRLIPLRAFWIQRREKSI